VARRFLLLAHRVPVSGAFTLNDLAGGAGRMDEIARSVSTALTLSNDLRRDTEVTVLFVAAPPPASRRIRIEGRRVRYLNPDERSTAALLKNALIRSLSLPHDVESSPGLVVGPAEPVRELERFLADPTAFWLVEDGQPIRSHAPASTAFAALLSDPTDPTEQERAVLERSGVPRVSVGPRSLRASQVIDLVHNEFDLREAAALKPPGTPSPEGRRATSVDEAPR
jgi:tRNA (pseudouridine54-N1)-methyltransferase